VEPAPAPPAVVIEPEPEPVATPAPPELPKTSSSLPVVQLLGGLSLLSGLVVRRFRVRSGTKV
jgi:LPXTG-motif cell wall-anchored protein